MSNRLSKVDPEMAVLLANCAFNAYYPNVHSDPLTGNFKWVDSWSGRNPSFFGGDVEPYGMVYQGSTPENEDVFIFAFKGTASWWDAYEDIFVDRVPFTSFHNSNSENQVLIAQGFHDVYTAAVTPGKRDSMQDQLMNLIHKHQPKKLIITGHSLGSALAELFNLDIYVSFPDRDYVTQHYNYACPRVGDSNYAALYANYENSKPIEQQTIRIVNYWDEIPCVPFGLMGYEHIPNYFMISFTKAGWWHLPNYMVRHSVFNYWQVLIDVMKTSDQQFQGPVTGYQGVALESQIPSASETECSIRFAEEISHWMERRE